MQCSGPLYAACLNGKCDCIYGYKVVNSSDCVLRMFFVFVCVFLVDFYRGEGRTGGSVACFCLIYGSFSIWVLYFSVALIIYLFIFFFFCFCFHLDVDQLQGNFPFIILILTSMILDISNNAVYTLNRMNRSLVKTFMSMRIDAVYGKA